MAHELTQAAETIVGPRTGRAEDHEWTLEATSSEFENRWDQSAQTVTREPWTNFIWHCHKCDARVKTGTPFMDAAGDAEQNLPTPRDVLLSTVQNDCLLESVARVHFA